MGRSRSRERKHKKRHRRSRSEESAARSRSREKRRRKAQNKYLSKQGQQRAQAAGIPDNKSMFWDGFQWVPKADAANTADHNATRKLRRLYLGNLPYHLGITEEMFANTLFEAMKSRGLCENPNENPVLHVWFARDKGQNYGFVELATSAESERVLTLDGLVCLGVPIVIKRPNDFLGNPQLLALTQGGAESGEKQPSANSKIVEVVEVADAHADADEFNDVLEDMLERLASHGKIRKSLIVTPSIKREEGFPTNASTGSVFLEFSTVEEADACIRKMSNVKYDGKPITMGSCTESLWEQMIRFAK
eukprot:GEMP01048902.1.p1 GENE.GEMP01048902.1~~GEMP01048902.1.p1  ORF type:complete len:306 (+),score=79.35 GEMP01048902.1:75-992(+)